MCGLDRQARIPAFFVINWGNREPGEEETQDTADCILQHREVSGVNDSTSGSPCQNKQVQIDLVEGGSSRQNKQHYLINIYNMVIRPHRGMAYALPRPLARMHAPTHLSLLPASR